MRWRKVGGVRGSSAGGRKPGGVGGRSDGVRGSSAGARKVGRVRGSSDGCEEASRRRRGRREALGGGSDALEEARTRRRRIRRTGRSSDALVEARRVGARSDAPAEGRTRRREVGRVGGSCGAWRGSSDASELRTTRPRKLRHGRRASHPDDPLLPRQGGSHPGERAPARITGSHPDDEARTRPRRRRPGRRAPTGGWGTSTAPGPPSSIEYDMDDGVGIVPGPSWLTRLQLESAPSIGGTGRVGVGWAGQGRPDDADHLGGRELRHVNAPLVAPGIGPRRRPPSLRRLTAIHQTWWIPLAADSRPGRVQSGDGSAPR